MNEIRVAVPDCASETMSPPNCSLGDVSVPVGVEVVDCITVLRVSKVCTDWCSSMGLELGVKMDS